ncbi:MAG: pilin [Patescibacteria group bacterium]
MNLLYKKLFCYFILLFCICFLFSANFCLAQNESLLQNSGDTSYSSGCIEKGDCQVNDFIVVAVRASEIILGIVGSLALLMFIYGGVMFLISAGNSEKVSQAKQIILGAIIGLVIVFTSWMIINFSMTALGYNQAGEWFKI